MKRIFSVVSLFALILSFQGCSLDDEQNFHFVTLQILEAEVPESFDLHEIYTIQVTYMRPNGCTFFEGFDVTATDNTTRNIVAIGSQITDEDTTCSDIVENVTAEFRFEVLYTGTYTFRFFNGNDEAGNPMFLEYEVEVNEEEPTN